MSTTLRWNHVPAEQVHRKPFYNRDAATTVENSNPNFSRRENHKILVIRQGWRVRILSFPSASSLFGNRTI
jgi:hypothetical protein